MVFNEDYYDVLLIYVISIWHVICVTLGLHTPDETGVVNLSEIAQNPLSIRHNMWSLKIAEKFKTFNILMNYT